MESRPEQAGLTRLEFAITIAIIAVLVAVFLHRTEILQGRIEAHSVRMDIDAMRTVVTLARVRGGATPGSNPVDLFAGDSPIEETGALGERDLRDRYAGIVDADQAEALPRGQWAYVPEQGWLVYRIRRPQRFGGAYIDEPPRIRVRIGGAADAPELLVEPTQP